MPYNFKLCS